MPQTASPSQIPTAQQLAGMSPAERETVYAQLGPDSGEQARASYEAFKSNANRQFMHLSIPKTAACPAAGGGYNNTFAQGATLRWDLPTAGGAYAKALVFTVHATFTLATGTSAVYALTPAGVLGFFSNLTVTLNGQQHNFPPYLLKYLKILNARSLNSEPQTVLSGTKVTAIENKLNNGGTYAVTAGAQTYDFRFRVPLNALAPTNPAGLLPMMASATKPQIALTTGAAFVGNDPEQNVFYSVSGTGQAISGIGGTVNVDVEYLDGQNLWSPQALALDLAGEPTVQYITDTVFNNIAQGSVQRARIQSLLQHYTVIAVGMDGMANGTFCALSNLARIEMSMDSVGQNQFQAFGTGTNIDVYDYYERFRQTYQQDIDPGVVVWVHGASQGINNPDNLDGVRLLNMTPGGWSDVNVGFQFTSVQSSIYTPRIAVYLVSQNPAGLKVANI